MRFSLIANRIERAANCSLDLAASVVGGWSVGAAAQFQKCRIDGCRGQSLCRCLEVSRRRSTSRFRCFCFGCGPCEGMPPSSFKMTSNRRLTSATRKNLRVAAAAAAARARPSLLFFSNENLRAHGLHYNLGRNKDSSCPEY